MSEDRIHGVRPSWCGTGNPRFPAAARVDGAWWVLRINGFPDHPLWTLFVGGSVIRHFDELPDGFGRPSAEGTEPRLAAHLTAEALSPVEHFIAFGAEHGTPCEDPVCCGG